MGKPITRLARYHSSKQSVKSTVCHDVHCNDPTHNHRERLASNRAWGVVTLVLMIPVIGFLAYSIINNDVKTPQTIRRDSRSASRVNMSI